MVKFEDITSLNQKYVKIINDFLEQEKPKLIEAFDNYYGVEYHDYISYTINNIKFIYVISEETLMAYKKLGKDLEPVINYYLSYVKYINNQINLLPSKQRKDYEFRALVVDSTVGVEEAIRYIDIDDDPILGPAFSNIYDFGQVKKVICLPIITINLLLIIHEINHALNTCSLAYLPDEEIRNNPFRDTIVDELINELMTYEIYEEYKKIGGKDIEGIPTFNYFNAYTTSLCLVKSFYDNFKFLLKRGLITHNDGLIINKLGKENLNKFCKLVDDLFMERINGEDLEKQSEIDLEVLNEAMIDHYLLSDDINYEEWFQKMREAGIMVRRLK